MYGEQYKHLSNDAKLAYMVLKDRLEYSLRNNWVDSEGHVYFIFTNQELMDLFNCSKGKVIKIKAELESIGLLVQKQMGFNPKTISVQARCESNRCLFTRRIWSKKLSNPCYERKFKK